MSHDVLRKHLDTLRKQIMETRPASPEASTALEELLGSVDNVLDHPGETSFKHHRMLMSSLTAAVQHFEFSHPTLTGLINNAITTLSALGI